jgi:hypothetical protein
MRDRRGMSKERISQKETVTHDQTQKGRNDFAVLITESIRQHVSKAVETII